MGSLWSVFWVFLLTGLNPHHKGAVAIDCWVCSSDTDAGCGESINTVVLQENKKTGSGCSACKKSFHAIGTVWSTVDRTCVYQAEDYCDDVLGYGDCVCTTTYCNGLSSAQSGIWKITFVISSSMFLFS